MLSHNQEKSSSLVFFVFFFYKMKKGNNNKVCLFFFVLILVVLFFHLSNRSHYERPSWPSPTLYSFFLFLESIGHCTSFGFMVVSRKAKGLFHA